ncbi:MAG TPA: hypothetical protein VF492_02640 [Verrucomicrobiae bacterium]
MPLLANIFPAAGNAAFAEDEKSIAPPNAGQAGAESFDDVMSRAQSPPGANVAAAQNRRQRTSFAGAQKRNPADSSPPPAPVQAGEDAAADPADLPAAIKTKAGAKVDDQHGKSANPLALAGAGVAADALPNPAVPLPAPTLPAWLLNLSAPAAPAKSAANNPAAAAALPVGGAEKNGAAPVADVPGADAAVKPPVADAISQLKSGEPQKPAAVKNLPAPKPDSPTSGLSAAALKLSVLAGTVAGDSAPQNMAAVPAGEAQPDNSIVLQNPAAESDANNPVAAAVTPFGGAGITGAAPVKNLPAPKPDSPTSGLSAAGPKLSVLAGTEAGDSAPQKNEAVPPGDARPDNSIVLQNPAPESAGHAPVKSHGTAVAKQDVPMKKTDQTNKVAGQAEKVLPGSVVSAVPEKVLPGRGLFAPVPARGERLEANAANLAVAPERVVGGPPPPDESAAISNVSDHAARALDRTHELVSLHALRLVDAKADLLQVVLKPGEGTKLSLQLRQRDDGGIEAQAVLQAGDFAHLKQHWPELQQRLEQRGIKLAPLTSDENSAAGSGSQGFQNQRNQPAAREPLFTGAVAGFGLAKGMTVRLDEPVVLAAGSGGWQTWA